MHFYLFSLVFGNIIRYTQHNITRQQSKKLKYKKKLGIHTSDHSLCVDF